MAEGRFQPPPTAAHYRLLPERNFLPITVTSHFQNFALLISLSTILNSSSRHGHWGFSYNVVPQGASIRHVVQQALRRGIVKSSSKYCETFVQGVFFNWCSPNGEWR